MPKKNSPLQQTLLEIISGRQRGPIAALLKGILWILTPVYRIATAIKNRKYSHRSASVTQVDVPVISIGNLTTGGTGKSPMVMWLAGKLREHDVRVAIVSRGYGAATNAGQTRLNDEALEMQQRLPDVPQLQDPDRVKSALIAIEELETQCIVMDDGFQHRKLHRDLDIVLVDATNPFGYGYVLPRGLLREPIVALSRADAVIVTRCQQVSIEVIDTICATIDAAIQQAIRKRASPQVICRVKTVATGWLKFNGTQIEIDEMGSDPVVACCAIGNPESFIQNAKTAGAQIAGQVFFPDHHRFTRADIESIVALAKSKGATKVICTHKDLVKIAVDQFDGVSFYALKIEIEFLQGESALLQRVQQVTGR